MREDIPSSISDSVYELEPDALAELFMLELQDQGNTIMYLNAYAELVWQGNTYISLPCTLSSVSQSVDGEKSRPKFSVANPQALFSSQVQSGALDNALLTQYKIMKADLDNDLDVKMTSIWRVTRIPSMNFKVLTMELRTALDGPSFKVPARTFIPPDFPHVSLR